MHFLKEITVHEMQKLRKEGVRKEEWTRVKEEKKEEWTRVAMDKDSKDSEEGKFERRENGLKQRDGVWEKGVGEG